MSGKASLGIFEIGTSKLRGNIKSFDKGGIKRIYTSNADGSVDYHEEQTPSRLVFEHAVTKDADLEAVEAQKDVVGLLTYRTNGVKYRIPKCGFSERGEIGPEGMVDITFCGEPGTRA